jgi:hypothetical protein
MSKSNSAEFATSSATFPFGSPEVFNDAFSDVLTRNRASIENAFRALNTETLRFVGKRFENTGHAIEECQGCKTIPELVTTQQKWAAEAIREYIEESFRLGETMQKLFVGFQAPVKTKESAAKSTGKGFAAGVTQPHA